MALGSTVVTTFLDDVLSARDSDRSSLKSAYEKLHWLLDSVGETYDPTRDSSELAGQELNLPLAWVPRRFRARLPAPAGIARLWRLLARLYRHPKCMRHSR